MKFMTEDFTPASFRGPASLAPELLFDYCSDEFFNFFVIYIKKGIQEIEALILPVVAPVCQEAQCVSDFQKSV